MNISVIGVGYVGLVSGACFADLGNNVWCMDKNLKKIDMLNNNQIPFFEPGLHELVKKNYASGRLKFTTNLNSAVKNSDIVFICVGTPTSQKNNSANLKYVFSAANEISKCINKFKIIITKSTVPVTTGDKIEKIISKNKKKKLFEVVSNPEFLREGESIRDFRFPDRIVIGTDNKKVIKKLKVLYDPLIKKGAKFFATNRKSAELIKYASNAFLATKITFINEIANLCEKTEINVDNVALGIGLDQRIGSRFLRAGPAYGGSCFPKDTKAITVTGDLFKTNLSLIKSVIKSNKKRKVLLAERVKKILSNKIKNKKIAFLGVTFKPNTDDMRQSTSLFMIPYLIKRGAMISYYEPSGEKKEISKMKNVTFFNDINKICHDIDLLIIHTEWEEFKALDFKKLTKKKKFKIYDLRNLYSSKQLKKLGLNYYSIGR
ncbi:UDP-glucose/GDP-mannose dehydrogenase family protein [Pelagibacteraceae bacterium]|jgi:UDPglucose 6-dehydrogenase|nr:UDP-glucose/GDP-mannose dehydrogenase family protein [Pelagibacteraceae bacterium]